jgi:hypothetical protein
MSTNPIDLAQVRTGWDPSVIAYLHDEFVETADDDDDDFLDYIAEQVATAALVIAASEGLGVGGCLEAYALGLESVLDEDFSVDEAMEAINQADFPEEE